MQLQSAMLFVADIALMSDFYARVMRFRPVDGSIAEHWIEYDTGPCRFAIHAIPPEFGSKVDRTPREGAPTRLDFAVADVEAERRRLEALGVPILVRPWGAVDAVDPEGNVFGLRPPR